jgi:hypothetical protein
MAFDCLFQRGRDLRDRPLAYRRETLEGSVDSSQLIYAARRCGRWQIPANIRERSVNTEANTDRLNRRRPRIYVAGCHEISAAKRNFVAARHEIPGRGGGLSLPYLSPYSLIAHGNTASAASFRLHGLEVAYAVLLTLPFLVGAAYIWHALVRERRTSGDGQAV